MKIIQLTSSINMDTSGVSICVRRLSEELVKQSLEIHIFSVGKPGKILHKSYWDERFSHSLFIFPIFKSMFFSNGLYKKIKFEVSNVSAIHSHGLWQMPNVYGGWFAGKSKTTPLIISPHGMLSPGALQFSKFKKWLFWSTFQRKAANAASCFHATCEEEYRDIRNYGLAAPVAIIPNGVDIPKWVEKSQINKRKQIISLGRIHPKKGLNRLVSAWAKLEADYPDWDLLLVGPNQNNHAEELQIQAKKLGLHRFSIVPAVFGEEKNDLLRASDIFVLPTLSENFALTVAESLAVGTPVISTKGAPWQGLEENGCGWWIEHGVEPLVIALREAISLSSKQRNEMGLRGREWMEIDFSWGMIARQMIEVYKWLSEGGNTPDFIRIN